MYFGYLSMKRLDKHNIMRFSLERKEKGEKKLLPEPEKIDISDLINESLLSNNNGGVLDGINVASIGGGK